MAVETDDFVPGDELKMTGSEQSNFILFMATFCFMAVGLNSQNAVMICLRR